MDKEAEQAQVAVLAVLRKARASLAHRWPLDDRQVPQEVLCTDSAMRLAKGAAEAVLGLLMRHSMLQARATQRACMLCNGQQMFVQDGTAGSCELELARPWACR